MKTIGQYSADMPNFSGNSRLLNKLRIAVAIIFLSQLIASLSVAQQDLKIAAIVNDEIISDYDIQSRADFVLFSSGLEISDREKSRIRFRILDDLINEKLKLQKTKQLKLRVSRKQIIAAISTLEKRNNLAKGRMIEILRQRNIDPTTFERQLEANLAWRNIVRKFLAKTGGVDEEMIDDQIKLIKRNKGKPEYLISEIFIAVDGEKSSSKVKDLINRLYSQITKGTQFGQVARSFSESASALRDGNLGWIRGDQLDPKLASVIPKMRRGDISSPLKLSDGYYILLLKNKRITQGVLFEEPELSIQQLVLPTNKFSTQSEVQAQLNLARSISNAAQNCKDMQVLEKEIGLPNSKLISGVKLSNFVPNVRMVAQDLEIGQASPPIQTKAGILILMVCSKKINNDEKKIRRKVARDISQKQAELISRRELMNLRRSAFIEIR